MSEKILDRSVFGNRLSEVMEGSSETIYSVAEKVSLKPSTISRYANGLMAPKIPTLYMLADIFNVNPLWLMGYDEPKHRDDLPPNAVPVDVDNLRRVPIMGRIACGKPLLAREDIEGYTFTTRNGGAEYFALRARGDSMDAAGIRDGYLVIVRRQDAVDNGQIAVVMVGQEDATLKRFRQDGRTVTLSPQSTNPAHQPIVLDAKKDQYRILGLVVEVSFSPV